MSSCGAGPYRISGGPELNCRFQAICACPRSCRSISEHRPSETAFPGGRRAFRGKQCRRAVGDNRSAPSRDTTPQTPSDSQTRAGIRTAKTGRGRSSTPSEWRSRPARGGEGHRSDDGSDGGRGRRRRRQGLGQAGPRRRPWQSPPHRLSASQQVRMAALGAVVEAGHRPLSGLHRQPDGGRHHCLRNSGGPGPEKKRPRRRTTSTTGRTARRWPPPVARSTGRLSRSRRSPRTCRTR